MKIQWTKFALCWQLKQSALWVTEVFGNGKIIAHIAHECATTLKKTLYSCENVTKMWNLGDWGCCDPFRWGKPDSWDDQRSGANLRKFFLVFWTRTFMAFIFMIKHNVQFELFDFCMRFWKWNLGGTHHNIGNAVQYRADVTGESEELKGKWLFFVIGESEELKEKLLSFVTGKRESENIKKKVNLMQCESERCVNVVDVRGQAWCAAVIQSQLVDKL